MFTDIVQKRLNHSSVSHINRNPPKKSPINTVDVSAMNGTVFFTSRTLAIPLNRPVCVLLLDLCSHQENWNVRYYSNHTFDTNSRTKDTLKIALITNHTDKTDKSSEMVCPNVLLFVLFICFRFALSHSLFLSFPLSQMMCLLF